MNAFEVLQKIITGRHSTKPVLMNGKKIEAEKINQLLQLADWAPTHGHTEPWRFIVFEGDAVKRFCSDHAQLYKNSVSADSFILANFEKIMKNGDNVSHIIAVYMMRGNNPKIPAIEEISATAAAVQNILLGAQALEIDALWSTGGMTHHPAMKKYFSLADEDVVMGLLYLGYSDEAPKERKRIVSLDQKIKWMD